MDVSKAAREVIALRFQNQVSEAQIRNVRRSRSEAIPCHQRVGHDNRAYGATGKRRIATIRAHLAPVWMGPRRRGRTALRLVPCRGVLCREPFENITCGLSTNRERIAQTARHPRLIQCPHLAVAPRTRPHQHHRARGQQGHSDRMPEDNTGPSRLAVTDNTPGAVELRRRGHVPRGSI